MGWTSRTWAATRWWARWCRSSTACRSSRATAGTRSRAWRASTISRRSARWSRRRIKGLQERDEPFPDIWLIDGGKGQLSSALAAFESLEVVPPTVIALAKREEEIFVQGRSEPIVLSRRSFALRLLQYVRDEAHRFAQHYHHLLRKKRTLGDDRRKKNRRASHAHLTHSTQTEIIRVHQ